MKKNTLGIFGLFVVIFLATAILNPDFVSGYNLQNITKWSSLFAVISIGVAFVIITGGIDLSIGSVVGLVAVVMSYMLTIEGFSPSLTVFSMLCLSAFIGLVHGLLITKARIQPFVVTLCGLLIYRSLARWLTDNQSLGPIPRGDVFRCPPVSRLDDQAGFVNKEFIEGLAAIFKGKIPITETFNLPTPFIFLAVIGVMAAIFLNRTIWGRYLLALGNNEDAARYSGINTDAVKVIAYIICSLLAGIGGMLFAFELNSVQPAQTGEFFELYAIAAAVLGGCSLRGGEGGILGVIIAASVIRLIYNSINMLGISSHLEFAILGLVILCGVIADESIKSVMAKRRTAQVNAAKK